MWEKIADYSKQIFPLCFAVATLLACLLCCHFVGNVVWDMLRLAWNPAWITNEIRLAQWQNFTLCTAIAVGFSAICFFARYWNQYKAGFQTLYRDMKKLWRPFLVALTAVILFCYIQKSIFCILCGIFFAVFVVLIAVYVCRRQALSEHSNTVTEEEKLPKKFEDWFDAKTPAEIIEWAKVEEPIESFDVDFFDMEAVKTRIVEQIQKYPRGISIGLLGGYGTGKSSIVNLVQEKLEKESPDLYVVSVVSCWGFASSASALENILNQVLSDISHQGFCTFSIRNLPLQFVREVTGNSTWYTRLASHFLKLWRPQEGFEDILMRLSDFLKVNRLHLVLVIEDIDRNDADGSHFSAADVLAAIHRLKKMENISLILSGRPYSEDFQIDFQKLCDGVESVPFVDKKIARNLFLKMEEYHQSRFVEDLSLETFDSSCGPSYSNLYQILINDMIDGISDSSILLRLSGAKYPYPSK